MPPTNTPAAGDLDLDQDVKVLLTIKKGPRSGNPRRGETLVIPVKLSQGFAVFKTTIMSFSTQQQFRSSRLLEEVIYFKKSKAASQAAYVELKETNFQRYFKERWAYIQAKDVDTWRADGVTPQQAFTFECFVYIEKPNDRGSAGSAASLRRATIGRMQEAAAELQQHLQQTGDQLGPIQRHHATVQIARRAPNAPVELPTDNTARQAEHLDLMAERVRERQEAQNERHEWRNVRMKLNGAVVEIPEELSLLREALGLPNYPLFRDGIFHNYVHPTMAPTDDIEDIDHMPESQAVANTQTNV